MSAELTGTVAPVSRIRSLLACGSGPPGSEPAHTCPGGRPPLPPAKAAPPARRTAAPPARIGRVAADSGVFGRLALPAIFVLAVACVETPWKDVGTGHKIQADRWYENGAVTFLSPRALDKYAGEGQALLAAAFGAGLAVEIPRAPVDWRKPLSFGGPRSDSDPAAGSDSLLLRPTDLRLVHEGEDVLRLRAEVGFLPATALVHLHESAAGCQAAVWVESLDAHIDLVSRRDLAGHLGVVVEEGGVSVEHTQPVAMLGPGCDEVAPASATVEATIADVVSKRLVEELTSPAPAGRFTSRLEQLAASLLGAGATGRLEAVVPAAAPEPGLFTMEVGARTVDCPRNAPKECGARSAMENLSGQVMIPLRVGIDARQNATAPAIDLSTGRAVGVPQLHPDEYDADFALAVPEDVLQATLLALARSGALFPSNCPDLTLGELRPDLDGGAAIPFPDGAPVSCRLRAGAAPVLALGCADTPPSVAISLAPVHVELYVRGWDMDWLLVSVDVGLTLGARPVLRPAPGGGAVIALDDSDIDVGGHSGGPEIPDGLAAVVRTTIEAAAGGFALFGIRDTYPYPLTDASFACYSSPGKPSHLIMYADLDTTAAPALGVVEAALTEGEPEQAGGSGGCAQRPAPTPPGWLLLLLVAAWVLTGRLTRADRPD